jgi:CheY-like chemotaxis protein
LVFSYAYDQINLAMLEELQPNLIILGFNLRDEGLGWEFLQLLKMNDATASIPIVVTTLPFQLSAELQDYLLIRYIKVVHKPLDLMACVELVRDTMLQASQSRVLFSGDRTLPILMVDDTDDLREETVLMLRFEGYRVDTAYNGQVALDRVSRAEFCLILLDIDMPVMNGYEFMNAYEKQLRPHTPVIVISGNPDVQLQVLPYFAVDILLKPVYKVHLLGEVSKYAEPA